MPCRASVGLIHLSNAPLATVVGEKGAQVLPSYLVVDHKIGCDYLIHYTLIDGSIDSVDIVISNHPSLRVYLNNPNGQ